jgi:hypothetical protein
LGFAFKRSKSASVIGIGSIISTWGGQTSVEEEAAAADDEDSAAS